MSGPIVGSIGNRKALDASGYGERRREVPVPCGLVSSRPKQSRLAGRNEWITHTRTQLL